MSVDLSDTDSQSEQLATLTSPDAASGRTVLDGAFSVLDALARADEGLGLTALARSSGLAKSSAHRLAEQLLTLGAVERFDQRYFVGPRMLRIGSAGNQIRCCGDARKGQSTPLPCDRVRWPRCGSCMRIDSATSVPLCRTDMLTCPTTSTPIRSLAPPPGVCSRGPPSGEVALPDCWTRREWRDLRDSLADPRATVIDHQDAVPGICCISAPVWWPSGACAGAVTVSVHGNELPVGLPILLSRTASRIRTALQQLGPSC